MIFLFLLIPTEYQKGIRILNYMTNYVNESILMTHYIHLIKKLPQLKSNKEYGLKSKIEILEDYTTSRYAREKPNILLPE